MLIVLNVWQRPSGVESDGVKLVSIDTVIRFSRKFLRISFCDLLQSQFPRQFSFGRQTSGWREPTESFRLRGHVKAELYARQEGQSLCPELAPAPVHFGWSELIEHSDESLVTKPQ